MRSSETPDLAELRVLLVHQWLYTWAGAERDLMELARLLPHADVLAGIVSPALRREQPVVERAIESWVGRIPFARTHHRWFLPVHAAAFATFDTSEYDVVISISHAFEKAVRARKPGAIHLSYCLSPPRYLWDLSAEHDALARPAQRLALRASRAPLRALDRRMARGVDRFVSQSAVVADRVRRAYGRDSAIVYPPVEAKPLRERPPGRENFLLSLGRLVPYKRNDLAIAAADRLGIPLVIAGEGPDRARLERIAGRGTRFTGQVSEEEAGSLLARCAAFVFCAEEDFGIAPIEANAHGAPVIAFARGGALETMKDERTAVFFHEQSVDAVATAVERCLSRTWFAAELMDNAARFAPGRFREGMRREIHLALSARGR